MLWHCCKRFASVIVFTCLLAEQAAAQVTITSTGSLNMARSFFGAALLPDGKVLVAGGHPASANCATTNTAELYDPAAGTWSYAGSMNKPKYLFTLTLLPTGKVLAAGGHQCSVSPSNANNLNELYDIAAGTWAAAAPMATARAAHTATFLDSGKVLIVGGVGPSSALLASAELYDPSTDSWTSAGSMATVRHSHTATLLADGRVLVVGGFRDGAANPSLPSAELYDPDTNSWSAVSPMAVPRHAHTATLLNDGRVLVTGGVTAGSPPLTSTEIYDPTTDTWSVAAPLNVARHSFGATLLVDGRELVTGGGGTGGPIPQSLPSVELYDPAADTWSPAGDMAGARNNHAAVRLLNGDVLVVGGNDSTLYPDSQIASAEIIHVGAADTTAPTINIASPTSTTYLVNQLVIADYSCSDSQSGVAECTGPVPSGASVPTATVGGHIFTVTAADNAGNTSTQSVIYSVGYNICALYDQTKAVRLGATIPIKLQLCDATGANLSAATILVNAVSLVQISGTATGDVVDAGNANPDNNFRYDASLGGYIFNLKTTGLATGTWKLEFTAGGDGVMHAVQFQVR